METKQEPSKGALRAAEAINEKIYSWVGRHLNDVALNGLATIIDKYTRPDWIECSERMPTEKDGNDYGSVNLFVDGDSWMDHWSVAYVASHWCPLPPGPEDK